MAEDPKRLRATLVDAGWDTPAPPPVPPPPPVQRPARSGVMMTPIPQSRPSMRPPTVPPPPPSALPPALPVQVAPRPAPGLPLPSQRVELPRDLPEYGIDGPASEATRVDRQMEARARAMNVLELASSINQIAGTRPAQAAHEGSLALDQHAREPLPGFRAAMLLRVKFAHGELPLWSLVTPLVILVALATAFAVAAVSTAPAAPESLVGVADAASPAQPEAVSPAPAPAPSLTTAAAPSNAAAEPASSADLPSLEALSPKLRSAEILEIASKHAGRQLGRARALSAALDRDPSLAQDEKTQAEIRRLLDNQETSRHLLGVIAGLPGPVSADLLYEVWTGTVLRNETTDLARALLLSEDVRAKASPALSVSLELRQAERCEDSAKILPRAIEHGDRRALHLLTKLTRRYGCGPNKREDCYPCLRGSDALDQAVKAVKNRREPKTFGRR